MAGPVWQFLPGRQHFGQLVNAINSDGKNSRCNNGSCLENEFVESLPVSGAAPDDGKVDGGAGQGSNDGRAAGERSTDLSMHRHGGGSRGSTGAAHQTAEC